MRVAVHHPERVEDGEKIPASVTAFRIGRIEDLVNPLTGETTPQEKVAEIFLAAAEEEFPDCEVVLERLVHNGDAPGEDPFGAGGTSSWVKHDEVAEGARSPDGTVIGVELAVEQAQAAGGGET